jgi:hypothetical protein
VHTAAALHVGEEVVRSGEMAAVLRARRSRTGASRHGGSVGQHHQLQRVHHARVPFVLDPGGLAGPALKWVMTTSLASSSSVRMACSCRRACQGRHRCWSLHPCLPWPRELRLPWPHGCVRPYLPWPRACIRWPLRRPSVGHSPST